MSSVTGWGRSTWGDGAWNSPDGVDVAGLAMTSALGTPSLVTTVFLNITGVGSTFGIGSTTFKSALNVTPTGVAATSGVGFCNVYEQIDTSQTPNYTDIVTSQTPNYTAIVTS
jgi:hypothetical protein